MGWLDPIPKAGKLYIGGLAALRRRELFQDEGITHVVSVLRYHIDEQMIAGYKHLQIQVDDEDDENLLESFTASNDFIRNALANGGKVFVHCAMGKSRSATICIAFIMSELGNTPTEALDIIRETRGVCEPNPGFMAQLWLYHEMGLPKDIDAHPMYQRWLYRRELESSRSVKQAPEADKIRFEDEYATHGLKAGLELKCRKCRRTLATSQYLVEHKPKQRPDTPQDSSLVPATACAHYFIDPLSWMRPELEKAKLEGRLECPKCSNNVGKYAWQGMQCSCGDWVVPAISLAKGRIDEAVDRTAAASRALPADVQPAAIRMPADQTQTGRRGAGVL